MLSGNPNIPERSVSYVPQASGAHHANPTPAAMTPAAQAYREEQLRIAAQAAEMNPELTGKKHKVNQV